MGGEGVGPFVQRGVEVGDDALLPLLVGVPELGFRLVRRVLQHMISLMSESRTDKFTHDRPHRKGEDLAQPEHTHERSHLGRLARWLLEQRLALGRKPVLVVALRRQRDVEAASSSSSATS